MNLFLEVSVFTNPPAIFSEVSYIESKNIYDLITVGFTFIMWLFWLVVALVTALALGAGTLEFFTLALGTIGTFDTCGYFIQSIYYVLYRVISIYTWS